MPDLAASNWTPSSSLPGRGKRLCQCSVEARWPLHLPTAPDLGCAGPQGWQVRTEQLQEPATPSAPPDSPMRAWQAVKNRVLVKAFGGFTHEPEAEAKVRQELSCLCWPSAW